MSIRALRPIEAHEEIFVSYNYRIWQAPEWYQEQWIKFKREVENISEEALLELTRRICRQFGVIVRIPSPEPESPRFVPCVYCARHVKPSDNCICCLECHRWSHCKCAGLEIEYMQNNPDMFSDWSCKNCQVLR